jgi:hypothetical protein
MSEKKEIIHFREHKGAQNAAVCTNRPWFRRSWTTFNREQVTCKRCLTIIAKRKDAP